MKLETDILDADDTRTVSEILDDLRIDNMRHTDDPDSVYERRLACYYGYFGEIDMAYYLRLITESEMMERKREWLNHRPRRRQRETEQIENQ